jgi:hypothetical protein
MKRINLIKYGFVRWPEQDFSDDGNRFQCYRAGEMVRVSKLVSNGQVYLSIDSGCGDHKLPHRIYSELPHYRAANWDYNGVSVESITDEDIVAFYDACVAYEKEYREAKAATVYPTLEELKEKASELYDQMTVDFEAIKELFGKHAFAAATKLTNYEWGTCREYLQYFEKELENSVPGTKASYLLGSPYSFDFMEKDYQESYYSKRIKEIFAKYDLV